MQGVYYFNLFQLNAKDQTIFRQKIVRLLVVGAKPNTVITSIPSRRYRLGNKLASLLARFHYPLTIFSRNHVAFSTQQFPHHFNLVWLTISIGVDIR